MMKSTIALSLALLIIFPLRGCSLRDPKYININSKPSLSYYTEELKKDAENDMTFKVSILDTNLYKEKEIPQAENTSFIKFLMAIKEDDYMNPSIDNSKNCIYKVFITFKSNKYLIKVYENETISVSPWDGVFQEDVLSELSIMPGEKLISICRYYFK
ncbi:MAG: DUF4883 family protein [Clostridiaceae bacterium]